VVRLPPGRIERPALLKINDEVEIVGLRDTRKAVVTGVEMFHKSLDQGQAGDNVGVLLRGIEKDDIERGQVLAKPGTITPHTEFKAEVLLLKKEEGGRHTPIFSGYVPRCSSELLMSPATSLYPKVWKCYARRQCQRGY